MIETAKVTFIWPPPPARVGVCVWEVMIALLMHAKRSAVLALIPCALFCLLYSIPKKGKSPTSPLSLVPQKLSAAREVLL